MKHTRPQRVEHGFTLIEVLIGSAILVFALVSALAVATHGFRYIADMRRAARSSQVLQQKMEDIRLVTIWTNITLLNNTTFSDTNLPGCRFSGTIRTSTYETYLGSPVVTRVTLTVTWTNQSRLVLSNSLSSLFCKDGLNSYIF
jgi:prepilin-type N-terminal cleavage/methylation domain-containing protein